MLIWTSNLNAMKISLKILLFIIVLFPIQKGAGQAKHTFEIKGGEFVYDDRPIQIHSGEMHYARIPKEY